MIDLFLVSLIAVSAFLLGVLVCTIVSRINALDDELSVGSETGIEEKNG